MKRRQTPVALIMLAISATPATTAQRGAAVRQRWGIFEVLSSDFGEPVAS